MATATAPRIRMAKEPDRWQLVRFLCGLGRESPYTPAPNIDHVAKMLPRFIEHEDVGFFVAVDGHTIVGVLVLMISDELLSGTRIASQVCWYVVPAHRGALGFRLLDEAEVWLTAHGVERWQMMAPDLRFAHAYTRRQFVLTNYVYERLLPCQQ